MHALRELYVAWEAPPPDPGELRGGVASPKSTEIIGELLLHLDVVCVRDPLQDWLEWAWQRQQLPHPDHLDAMGRMHL